MLDWVLNMPEYTKKLEKLSFLSYVVFVNKCKTVLLEIDHTTSHGRFLIFRGTISSVLKEFPKCIITKDRSLR